MNIAYIPVRGGSKSIPLKNIKPIAGKPLVYWVINAACGCAAIDKVFICTDSDAIRDTVAVFASPKVEIVGRSAESATDTASTEMGMSEFAETRCFDNIALIQATSPLLTSNDLEKGFDLLRQSDADSILSVVRQRRFIWTDTEEGYAHPQNYDYLYRPRRQEFDGFLVENGAFYITSRELFTKSRCRISGRIKTVEMPSESYVELDEPEDWTIVEAFLKKREANTGFPVIKMFLTDCDGTLTDGGMYYTSAGEAMKKFNTRDGVGLRLLKECGVITGIITGENSEIVRSRAEKLGVDEVFIGAENKAEVISRLCEKYGINEQNVAYIGDDVNDTEALRLSGLAFCVADATDAVKTEADYVTKSSGGHGAVREAAEYILEKQWYENGR